MVISLVINADNRIGYLEDSSIVGKYGAGSLQGVRSSDLLTYGIQNKIDFFKGYDIQCILYMDVHEKLPDLLLAEMTRIVESCGNHSRVVLAPHSKSQYRWNDHLYINALRYAEGEYTCHMDMDCAAFKKEGYDIVGWYINRLNNRYKYICQPWDRVGDDMWWASTRFFICKTASINLEWLTNNLTTPVMGKHTPCVEHLLGVYAGDGQVIYPPRDDENYIIFCWASYFSGLMKHLMEQPYEKTIKYLSDCGIYGTHDIISKPIINE